MLNELKRVHDGILQLDEPELKDLHKEISEPPGKNVLRVLIDGNKNVISVECLEKGANSNYWCIGGNQNKFPSMKLTFPIRPGGIETYGQWRSENKNPSFEKFRNFVGEHRNKHPLELQENKCWPKYRDRLIDRHQCFDGLEGDSRIINELWLAYRKFSDNGLDLIRQVDEKLWQKLCRSPDKEYVKYAAAVMFSNGKLDMKDSERIALLLDFESGDFPSAANKYWKDDLSKILFERDKKGETKKGKCALSGVDGVALKDKPFSKIMCPNFGYVSIFNRKAQVPTYSRYEMESLDSMPVDEALSDELAAALRYLNDQEKGTTWDTVSNENGGSDLLLAFCSSAPPSVKSTGIFTQQDKDNDFSESDYVLQAKQICESFRGIKIELMENIDYFLIRKISDGVQKVVFSTSLPVAELDTLTEEWCKGCKNTPLNPDISLVAFKQKSKEFYQAKPKAISPAAFVHVFRKHYPRDIDRSKPTTVPGAAFSSIVGMFIAPKVSSATCNRMLGKLIAQYANLFELAALRQRTEVKRYNPQKHNQDTLNAVTVMCFLLYKLGRNREKYMNDLAFKLGQYCAALDVLHIGYCHDQRKGQIPPKLIGNEAYSAALKSPARMLDITSQRVAVYKAWSDRVSLESIKDEKVAKQVRFALSARSFIRKVSLELHTLPKAHPSATAEYRAELMLGYLAGLPKKTQESNTQETSKTQKENSNDSN